MTTITGRSEIAAKEKAKRKHTNKRTSVKSLCIEKFKCEENYIKICTRKTKYENGKCEKNESQQKRKLIHKFFNKFSKFSM